MGLNRNQIRAFESRLIEGIGIPSAVLMENAGKAAAEVMFSLGIQGPVLIVCGKGNNGGDGLVMARYLALWNIPLQIHLFGSTEDLTPETTLQKRIIDGMNLPMISFRSPNDFENWHQINLNQYEWIVDALFGIGLRGELRSPWDGVISKINTHPSIFAVDIPSGMECDTGNFWAQPYERLTRQRLLLPSWDLKIPLLKKGLEKSM